MYYIKLVFINIFRSLRYTIPLFLIFALTTGIVILTDNARKAGNLLKEQIALSHVTTVEVLYSPPFLMSGKGTGAGMESVTWGEIKSPSAFPQVEIGSFCFSYGASNPFLWEVNFDKGGADGRDIVITDQIMLGRLSIYGIRNSQYNDSITLTCGRHITDGDDGLCCALISSKLAEACRLEVGDTISFPLGNSFDRDDLMMQEYEIVGIADYAGSCAMFIPHSTVLEKYDPAALGIGSGSQDIAVFDVKFILKSPDLAAEFIEKAIPYFEEKDYSLQADDYEYKREIYPVEMMINLNSTLYIACIVTGAILLSVIMIKSAFTRVKDITVLRFLSCKKGRVFLVFYLEKFIVMAAGVSAGLIASLFLGESYNSINAIREKTAFGINLNAVLFIVAIVLVCTLLLTVVFISAVRKKPMEAMAHE